MELDEPLAEPAPDLGDQLGVVGDGPELHRQAGASGDVDVDQHAALPGRDRTTSRNARIASSSRSPEAPKNRTCSTLPAAASVGRVGASARSAARARASSGNAGSSSTSGSATDAPGGSWYVGIGSAGAIENSWTERNRPAFVPSREDVVDHALADVLDRRQPEADRATLDAEVDLALLMSGGSTSIFMRRHSSTTAATFALLSMMLVSSAAMYSAG